jgi:hypothetical protein
MLGLAAPPIPQTVQLSMLRPTFKARSMLVSPAASGVTAAYRLSPP